ncbi:fatty-acyl-CoA synthase [Pseudonocardia ammonioxydans]|uniref:Fatty-acyl-CoA synthase n=1 Tax=Pseudonocardia ammonioxydans TaxID=260086 RepID=A0A1I5BWZ0_PSUAM|nr:AMP-binding protein [Pseudonocardia ammonioxydans]SFN79233.1 fatty-acyl-CoA synthase [Pseudonocardia ammonioxydans]
MTRRWIEATTLGDLVERRAAEQPDAEALVFPSERVTYAGLAARATRRARELAGLGVGPGDRVALLLPADADLVATLVGTTMLGAVAVPVNARFRGSEITGVLTTAGARVLVTAPDLLGVVDECLPPDGAARPDAPELEHVVVPGVAADPPGAVGADRLAAGAVALGLVEELAAAVRVRDTAVLVFTSGTTAAPKGAMLSHEALVRLAFGIGDRLGWRPGERVWTAIPLFHGGGITFALSCLAAGATFVHPGHFDPTTTLELLTAERVTVALAAFETIWMPVLNRPDFASFDLSRIRQVMAVGVPERLRDMAARLPQAVHVSCVAMTESSAFLTLNRPDDPAEARASTGGHPMPGMRCRVVDPETGTDVAPGTPGELWFRGPNAFDGYFRDPAATAAAFTADGWFRTGDLVVADDAGRLTFRSRLKDMLKVGGENVAAAEVEGFLLAHPAVDLVAVVAAPDARYVEVPCAYVRLRPGHAVTEQELIEHCLGRIATFRVPRYVRFVDEFPMSGTKIKKFELRERIAAELAAAGITEAPRPQVPAVPR